MKKFKTKELQEKIILQLINLKMKHKHETHFQTIKLEKTHS